MLKVHGGWMTRRDLASAIGKRQLIPHDLELLNRLIEKNLVLVEKRERRGMIPYQLVYKAAKAE